MLEPSKSLYERIGGEQGVYTMVERFYYYMNELEGVEQLRELHQSNMNEIKEKLIMYFTGWFGGPPLFADRYGHPQLRRRHTHVSIGTLERDQWLKCMQTSLKSMDLDDELYQDIWEKIVPMADHMRNIESDGDPTDNCL